MVPLFTGHLSASHGLLPAFKALRSMPTAARGVLVVITEQGEAELAISEQGLIIGALIRQKNEQGIFALKKILDWKNGKYAFFEGDEYPSDHIKKTLRMDIVNIIRGAEDPSTLSGGTTGTNPRVDISSVHNKALRPEDIAAQQNAIAPQPQGQQVASQPHYQQQQPQLQPQLQHQQAALQPYPQEQQSYAQQPHEANVQPPMPAAQSMAPNAVSFQAGATTASSGKPAKKPRKFASTNFAMDVFGSEAPVAPAPKVGETVEDDLLRNLSDLNRLGPSSPAPRPMQNQAPAAPLPGGPGPGSPIGPGPMGAPGSYNPPPMPQSGMPFQQGGPTPGVPSQLGRIPAAPQAGTAPAGMMPPGGMATNQGINQQSTGVSGSGSASYQHQQNVSELQRQAMADEAALMQAISSTTVPVFVPGGAPGSQGGSLINEALYSEQQIRAAQSVSGGYSDVSGYPQPQSNAPSHQPLQNQVIPAAQPPSQLTPPVPSQLQQPAAAVPPRAMSPSGSPSLEGKAKINPTKTLLESDLFFVDDELTDDQSEPPIPPLQSSYQKPPSDPYGISTAGNGVSNAQGGMSSAQGNSNIVDDSGISGGYAPSSMTARGQSPAGASEPSSGYGDSQSPTLGANFSQTPSFGPGSSGTGAGSKNPGSAILESMKKRNLEGRSSSESNLKYTPPDLIPPKSAASSPNALNQFNQSQIQAGSSADIQNLNQPMANAPQPKFDSQTGLPLGAQISSQLGSRNSGDLGAPNVTPGVANARARIAQSGAYANQLSYDDNSGATGLSDISSSATYQAREQVPESYDEIANPQVGMATSSRIARSVSSPGEVSVKGKRDDEASGTVARSRIRSGATQERSGFAAFFEQNKMMVLVAGGLLLVLILVGLIIGVLFAMHVIKT